VWKKLVHIRFHTLQETQQTGIVKNIVKVHCNLYVSLTTLKRSGIAMPTSTGLPPMNTWIDWPVWTFTNFILKFLNVATMITSSCTCSCCPCEHAAHCGCMNNSLVLNTHSSGAEVAGIQKIFSNSSCKSANSFFYLTRSQRVPWLLHRDSRAT